MDFSPPKYTVTIIKEGFRKNAKGTSEQSTTCTLLKGPHNILVETGSVAETDLIHKSLREHDLSPEQIEYVICTHGHPENIGNLSMFPEATHIVGFDVMKGRSCIHHDFRNGIEFEIDDYVSVLPTPGMCHSAVSVLARNSNLGHLAIAGSVFHSEEDLEDPDIWEELSADPDTQQSSRIEILKWAQFVIPRYGGPFRIPDTYKTEMKVVMTP